jgi:hypothetical protein
MLAPAAASAAALTSAQVQSILNLLTQFGADATTIANVNASLTGGAPVQQPAQTPGNCTGVSFTRTLVIGSTGSDVKCLQTILNLSSTTQVAITGAGSPGSETSHFGSLTLSAVRKYQVQNGWTPANQVGPLTRAALNAQVAGGNIGGTGAATLCSNGNTLASNCTLAPNAQAGALCPDGIHTIASNCTLLPTAQATTNTEGSITVTADVSPSSGTTMHTGDNNVAVAAVDVKATGSNVTVNRLDVIFHGLAGSATCNIRPWILINQAIVSDGITSKTIAINSATDVTENIVGDTYTVRVDGLNMLVAKDTTKKITLSVDAVNSLPAAATTCTPSIQFGAGAIRGTDGAGISQISGGALAVTTFTVNTGDAGTLDVTVAPDNPKARNVIVQEAAQTADVVLLKVNVQAKSNAVILRTLRVNSVSSSGSLATVMPTIKLWDGTTQLAATTTVIAGSSTFDTINLTIPMGTMKTLTVTGTFAKTNTSIISEGDNVRTTLTAADIAGEDATTYAAVLGAGAYVDGNLAYLFLKAPTLTLASATLTPLTEIAASATTQRYNATLSFNVTANGGDIYIRGLNATAASSGIVAQAITSAASTTLVQSFTTNATAGVNNTWKVSSGDTKHFDVTGVLTATGISSEAGYFEGMSLLNVKWGATDVDEDGPFTAGTQTWGLDDLKTGTLYLITRQ